MNIDTFNEKFTGHLQIKLSKAAVPVSQRVMNGKAIPSAKIISLKLNVEIFDEDKFRKATQEELDEIIFDIAKITIRSLESLSTEHMAPNSKNFTVKDFFAAIEEHERVIRPKINWFGGVDIHHVCFEGIMEIKQYFAGLYPRPC